MLQHSGPVGVESLGFGRPTGEADVLDILLDKIGQLSFYTGTMVHARTEDDKVAGDKRWVMVASTHPNLSVPTTSHALTPFNY